MANIVCFHSVTRVSLKNKMPEKVSFLHEVKFRGKLKRSYVKVATFVFCMFDLVKGLQSN